MDVGAPGHRTLEQLADWTVELLLPGLRRFT